MLENQALYAMADAMADAMGESSQSAALHQALYAMADAMADAMGAISMYAHAAVGDEDDGEEGDVDDGAPHAVHSSTQPRGVSYAASHEPSPKPSGARRAPNTSSGRGRVGCADACEPAPAGIGDGLARRRVRVASCRLACSLPPDAAARRPRARTAAAAA